MAKIQVLDRHTAELIAAGEVVERPASVVKELFENAVDAGATLITVEIEHGGVTMLRVTDNGSGIEREDVPTAFLRHATSKVRTADDLESIGTLGFRGEALASVAEVARVEMVTRTEAEEVGTHYVIEGGEEQECEDVGCAKGTTVCVRDLFFNIPARMKFLKTDMGEGNAVSGVLDHLALSHPEIAVRFVRDGKEVLSTAGDGDVYGCIYAVLGRDFAKTLMPVDYEMGGIRVTGFANKPEFGRQNRTMQRFFLNGRYVKTRTAAAALEQAYKGSLMVGKLPTCVLYIELPADAVDVNVHPTKLDVRFLRDKPVFDAVYYAIKSALENLHTRKEAHLPTPKGGATSVPSGGGFSAPTAEQLRLSFSALETPKSAPETPAAPASKPAAPAAPAPKTVLHDGGDEGFTAYKSFAPAAPTKAPEPAPQAAFEDVKPIAITPEIVEIAPQMPAKEPETAPEIPLTAQPEKSGEITVLGEAFATYIFAEMDGELYVIDKHAAHERILYNRLRETPHTEAQQLLAPVTVTVSPEELEALTNAADELEAAGFEVEPFGAREVIVRAVPLMLCDRDVTETVLEVASGLCTGKTEVTTDRLDWLYHNTACRAAVKAGDRSTPDEWKTLAEAVLHNDAIRTCPHGRPVCITLSRKELEKQFGRIV